MNKYYFVIETGSPYKHKKYSVFATIGNISEKTIAQVRQAFEVQNNIADNHSIITFIQKLDSEEEE